MRERREFVSMVCKKEVIAWFSDLTTWRRIDFLCALMDCCGSAELRFLGTYIEALCRRDYDSLREAELSANDVSYLSKLTSASDKRILDKVLTSLALMNSRCTEGARVLFKMLQEHTDAILNGHDEPVLCDRENANCRETDEKVVLLAVMAVNHPAFTFSQKQAIRRQLSALLQAVESEAAIDVEPEGGDSQPNTKAESKCNCGKNSRPETVSEDVDKSQEDKGTACIETIEMDSFQIRPSDKRYECVFKVHWKNGVVSTVSKTHAELFEFQCKLVQRFPEVSSKERVIPYVPGETQGKHIFSGAQARDSAEKITSKDFLEYARKLSALPSSILNCDLMVDFFKENIQAQGVPSVSPSTVSSNSSTSSTSKTIHSPPHRSKTNQHGENQVPPETMPSTPSSQGQQQQQQQPHVHLASPIPHPVYPLTASLRHLDISHHHNINLTPPGPINISAQLNPSQPIPPVSSVTSSASTSSSGTNSVYFQTISSAVSIPTPAELYNVGDSNSDHIATPKQPFEAPLLSKAQASSQANSVSFAPPLPSTTEAYVSKVNASDSGAITSNENGDVPPPVMATPMVHLHPHPHPMPCFTTSSDCQPFSSTAMPKSPVSSQIQEWLKKQRLHKYEHFFEGLSVAQIVDLTDEDIDKWEIVTGAKGRIKSHLEQLRQSLMNPANGMTNSTPMEQSQYPTTHPVTFIPQPAGPVPLHYYFIHPNSMPPGMIGPQFIPSATGHEGAMSSDNSSSGSLSRESSDECDRDSEESGPCGFQSQDVRTHCHVEPNRKHGAHTPRNHQSKLSHANSKSAGSHTVPVSPVPYSQVVKNPVSPSGGGGKKDSHKGSRNSRSGTAPPVKRLPTPSDGTPQVGHHPALIVRGNTNSPVPHIAHSVMMSPRGQGKNEPEVPTGIPPRQQKSSGSQKVNQPNIARSQMAAVPQMHGTSNQGWHHPSNNGSQLMMGNHGILGLPGNVVTSHLATGQQMGSIQGVTTSIQNLQMEQYSQNSQPRVEVPPHVPMVQVKHHGNRQSGGTNHFMGEDGMGYRTVVMQSGVPVQVNSPNVSSESLQGHASPGMRSDGSYIGSATGPPPSNPKVIYTNPANQLPGSSSAPSSHTPSDNFNASSTTTYVQAANQNTVSVVASSLGMMQLAYTNQMVLAGSASCSCNPTNGNQSNQSCPIHQFPVTNALLPNPPYLPYQNFQNFFQGGVGSNHIVQPVNVLKGPTAPSNPRYMTVGPGPTTATIPSEILYGNHYGSMAQQGQMFFNQMSMGQRGPHSPHAGMIPDGSKKATLSCFNCGAQGHKASECRETTMETITQNSHYRLNFKPDSTDS